MFQNAAVDVAIALSLMYLMLSLLCTVVNEFIATKLRLRAKSLASALVQLIDNKTLRDTFYQHGLIVASTRAASTGAQSAVSAIARGLKIVKSDPSAAPPAINEHHPTYLSSRNVALALIGSLDPATPLPAIPDIQDAVRNLPWSQIRDALLSALTEAGNDLDKLRAAISTWFDDAMERLSGAYKRQLKWISMLIGLSIAVVFNADSVAVATALWKDQALRESVATVAAKMSQNAPAKVGGDVDLQSLKGSINDTLNALKPLPIGWNCLAADGTASAKTSYWECAERTLHDRAVTAPLGWILTAIALSLGAPFWFDLLQKFVNIRGAGAKPKREDEK